MRACKAPEPLTSARTSERIPESRLPRGGGAAEAIGYAAAARKEVFALLAVHGPVPRRVTGLGAAEDRPYRRVAHSVSVGRGLKSG